MTIVRKFKHLVNKVRISFFPTLHETEAQKYFAEGGDERFRFNFDLNEDSLVIDLGGYKGQWASDIYSKYLCNILVFEPVASYYNKITERFKANKKIQVFCLALGDTKKTERIGISEDGSSFFIKSHLYEIMEFEDVATFFKSYDINVVDLLKINIEGGEYALLGRLIETGLINKIKHVHVQFHDFVPNAEVRMDELQKKLALTHDLTLQYKFVWENWILKNKTV